MKDDVVDVVIVGAGQAGLSLSHELAAAGADHVVLERGRVGETWRGRWDSFCLVIPNCTVQVPSGRTRGLALDGVMARKIHTRTLGAFAQRVRAPARVGVTVSRVAGSDDR